MKTKLLTLTIILLSSLGLMAQISGTVVNSSTQAPIANHTVYLAGDSTSGINLTTTTNAQGQYSFSNLGSSTFYDVFTFNCNQSLVINTVTSSTATVNFSICGTSTGSCAANFNSVPDSTTSLLFHFTDQSTGNPTSWFWSFGDGDTSTLQNPSHQYASSGVYLVYLKIASATCTDSVAQFIFANTSGGCNSYFIAVPDSSTQGLFHFMDMSSGNPTSWAWNFGDGSTSTLQNPSHQYSTTGVYNVSLTISSSNCSDSSSQPVVYTNGNPGGGCNAAYSFAPDSTNALSIHFTDQSTGNPTSWTWDFGDGTTSNLQNPTHQYSASGSYLVQLTISSTNCSDSTVQVIYVNGTGGGCFANFAYLPDSNVAGSYHFFDMSAGNPTAWAWDFGDSTTSNLQNPTHQYTSVGVYTVKLVISSANCTDSIVQTVVYGGGNPVNCTADFNFTPDSTNANKIYFTDQSTGNPTIWTWNFGDGTTSNLQNPTHTYATSGTYVVGLLISGNNCQSIKVKTVVIGSGSGTNNISGQVMAGTNSLDIGVVGLIDTTSGGLINVVSVDSTGMYHFTNVPNGTYWVYASPMPGSAYMNYAPTYHLNSVMWSGATAVTAASQTTANINLYKVTPLIGTGSISGNLSTGSKGAVANTVVNLLDNNNDLVATTVTDQSGNYNFDDLAFDTYKIWVEIAGKTTTPIVVNLNSNYDSSTGNDFVVKGKTITPKATGIADEKNNIVSKIYPNPVVNHLNIELNAQESEHINIRIYNVSGQMVMEQDYNISAGNQSIRLDVNDLAKGSYILRINNTKSTVLNKLFTVVK